jgi:hypothetical protein
MDQIGNYSFIRLSRPPDRVSPQWSLSARAGVPGLALWNTDARGTPFTVESEAVALTFVLGRTFLMNYKQLETAGPVSVRYGTVEPQQIYKVLKVEWSGPGVKAVARAHVANDPTWYRALVFASWTLLPIDPFASP